MCKTGALPTELYALKEYQFIERGNFPQERIAKFALEAKNEYHNYEKNIDLMQIQKDSFFLLDEFDR